MLDTYIKNPKDTGTWDWLVKIAGGHEPEGWILNAVKEEELKKRKEKVEKILDRVDKIKDSLNVRIRKNTETPLFQPEIEAGERFSIEFQLPPSSEHKDMIAFMINPLYLIEFLIPNAWDLSTNIRERIELTAPAYWIKGKRHILGMFSPKNLVLPLLRYLTQMNILENHINFLDEFISLASNSDTLVFKGVLLLS